MLFRNFNLTFLISSSLWKSRTVLTTESTRMPKDGLKNDYRYKRHKGESWPGDVGEGDRDDAHGLAAEEVVGHGVLTLDAAEVDADEGGEAEQGTEDGVLDQAELRVRGENHWGDRGVDDVHLEQRRIPMRCGRTAGE